MLRVFFAVVALVTSLLGLSAPAAACSAGPFELSELTSLLVLGRVTSLEIGPRTISDFREATVTVDVLRTYRGDRFAQVHYVDKASLSILRDPSSGRDVVTFAGGSGACGTIDFDPIGKYVLIGLARGEDGRWQADRLFGAIYTDAPQDAAYRWLLYRHNVALPFLVSSTLVEPPPDAAFTP